MLENILKTVLDMSLSASFLIVAVLIARVLLRKSSKLFRKALWALVAVRLVVPFSFESALSLVPHHSEYVNVSTEFSADVTTAVTNSGFDRSNALLFVWLGVFAFLVVYAIISFLKLKLRISDAVLLDGNVFQSEKVKSPFVFGILKPKIYVSYDIKGENLDYVLKHERTHIKYFDHITKIIGFAILCVHWFNPLVWVSYVLFCKDVELACDEVVVKDMTAEKRKGYALALCNIGINKAGISVCPVAFGEMSIKERVKSAISYKRIGKIAFALSVVLCITVAVCFMTSPESNVVEKTKKPVEEISVEETTEPQTDTVTEKVSDPTTEPVTEIITTESTESPVQTYNEDVSYENGSLDDPEVKERMKKEQEETMLRIQRMHTQQLEEAARERELAEMQEKYNNKNDDYKGTVSAFNYREPSGPTGGVPYPSVPSLF